MPLPRVVSSLTRCRVLRDDRYQVGKFTTAKPAVVPAEWQLLTAVFDEGTVSFYSNGNLLETLNSRTKHDLNECKDGNEESETKVDNDKAETNVADDNDTTTAVEMKKCSVKSMTLFGSKKTPIASATALFHGDAREVGHFIQRSIPISFVL